MAFRSPAVTNVRSGAAAAQLRGMDEHKLQASGLTKEELDELREAFELFDQDHSGTIDARELKAAMESLGYDKKNRTILQTIDSMKDGQIDFEMFVDMMTARMGTSAEDMKKVFALFDENSNGRISIEDLQRVAITLGDPMTTAELNEMISRGDTKSKGYIDLEDFTAIMMAGSNRS